MNNGHFNESNTTAKCKGHRLSHQEVPKTQDIKKNGVVNNNNNLVVCGSIGGVSVDGVSASSCVVCSAGIVIASFNVCSCYW